MFICTSLRTRWIWPKIFKYTYIWICIHVGHIQAYTHTYIHLLRSWDHWRLFAAFQRIPCFRRCQVRMYNAWSMDDLLAAFGQIPLPRPSRRLAIIDMELWWIGFDFVWAQKIFIQVVPNKIFTFKKKNANFILSLGSFASLFFVERIFESKKNKQRNVWFPKITKRWAKILYGTGLRGLLWGINGF